MSRVVSIRSIMICSITREIKAEVKVEVKVEIKAEI
jgi:uncharacterized OsmC-like protein